MMLQASMIKFLNRHNFLFYFPRILACIFVFLLALFALDVFAQYSGWSVILPLLIHLLPAIILLVATIIAWKHELIGTLIFLVFALLYLSNVGFNQHWSWYVVILLPATLISLFFFLSWLEKRKKSKFF